MTLCDYLECYDKILKLIGKCNYCQLSFCSIHRLPEKHNCVKLDEYISKKKKN